MSPKQEKQIAGTGISSQIEAYLQGSSGKIQAQISSLKDSLNIIKNVSIVRVRGKDSRLLIMEDYMPIIGEIEGGIDFIGKDFYQTFEPIHGFFCHEHNVFFLLLREETIEGKAFEQSAVEKTPLASNSLEVEPVG